MKNKIVVIEGGSNTRLGNCLIYLEYLIGLALRLNRQICFPKLETAMKPCFQYQDSSILRDCFALFLKSPLQVQAEVQKLITQAMNKENYYIAPTSHVMIHVTENNTAVLSKCPSYNGTIDIEEICSDVCCFDTVILSGLFPMKSINRISLASYIKINDSFVSPVVAELQKLKQSHDAPLIGIHARRTDYRRWKDGLFFYSHDQYCELATALHSFYQKKALFYLFSDEDNFNLSTSSLPSDFRLEYIRLDAAQSLLAMGYMDYVYGPPSTYSSMASHVSRSILGGSGCNIIHIHNVVEFLGRLRASQKQDGR